MSSNPKFYPDSLAVAEKSSALARQPSSEQISIADIRRDQARAALNASYAQRQSTQAAIRIENAQLIVIADYMPIPLIGKAAQTAIDREVGSISFFIGTTPDDSTIDKVLLKNLILQPAGIQLLTTRGRAGTFNSNSKGYIFGGTDWYTTFRNVKHTRREIRWRWVAKTVTRTTTVHH